ncbi:AAA family ATPase [Conexivisphaera calida]|uniref:Uncharacterized protein n=1 Tax=Conexivisphaera calida TaxID=1874277 RepID=A0A4P2VDN8_9ARCH|nr:ATP-binding protein [Conexivisphaera calida]BBE42746.1 hypothetical protein NAS2_1358 [Conexivisphaera calida]
MGNEVTFNWGGDDRLNFAFLLEALNDWAENDVVLVLDEAQELVKLRGADLLGPLAYSYDHLNRLKIILSGSEMGLLYRFLKIDDPDSPLFGRFLGRIELLPFNRENAVEFLSTGFKELKLPEIDYDKVYEELGGIPGWLTYFGYTYYETRDLQGSLESTLERARSLIAREFSNFLRGREITRQRYYAVMKQIARNGCSRWSWIKTALEAQAGTAISDSEIHGYLKALMESSWLTKDEGGIVRQKLSSEECFQVAKT